jgi:hypothetical protein
MSWKPIPQEAPSNELLRKDRKDRSTHVSPKFLKHPLYKKKRNKHPKTSYRLYQSVSIRLLDFIQKEKKHTTKDIDALIMDMQKTVSNLQKKRLYILKKKHKRRKKDN